MRAPDRHSLAKDKLGDPHQGLNLSEPQSLISPLVGIIPLLLLFCPLNGQNAGTPHVPGNIGILFFSHILFFNGSEKGSKLYLA